MGRPPCCDENGLKKGPWTAEEDQLLVQYIQKHGHGSWRALPKLAGLNRCGKSCRLRWTNYLRPDIKRGKFSPEEEQTILDLHSILGNKWSAIATHLPGRTDNEIKNFWNTHLKKKLIQMGFDPMTHRPRTDFFSTLPQLIALVNLRDLVDGSLPWDDQTAAAQLRAEAVQAAKVQYFQYLLQSAATMVSSASTANLDSVSLLSPPDQEIMTTSSFPSGISSNSTCLQNVYRHEQINQNLTDIQVPNSSFFEQPLLNESFNHSSILTDQLSLEGENTTYTPRTPFIFSPPSSSLPPLIDVSMNNHGSGDACSTSSCGGTPSFWPELLFDDVPFTSEFA